MTEDPNQDSRVLILRTCAADMSSHGGFLWPRSGRVEAPDWHPTQACGNGLHGFLHGEGNGGLASWKPDAVWIAAWVDPALVVDLVGKVKFPWAEVAVAGTREEAIAFLRAHGCAGAIVGSTITGGDGSTITGGDRSTITGGDGSTITGGDRSTITGGYRSTITGGDRSTITGGDGSTITGGYRSTITGGYRSTITGGDRSTIVCRYWNGDKYRTAVFEVGEDGIEANQPYRCDESGKLVKVAPAVTA